MNSKHLKLTEEYRQELVLIEQLVQHLAVHLFDLVLDLEHILRRQPVHHPLVVVHVTVVQHRQLLPNVYKMFLF